MYLIHILKAMFEHCAAYYSAMLKISYHHVTRIYEIIDHETVINFQFTADYSAFYENPLPAILINSLKFTNLSGTTRIPNEIPINRKIVREFKRIEHLLGEIK